jgi:serine/threonine protein kinase
LKPENLMLCGDLHTGSLTLIDFGLAIDCAPGKVVHADVAGTRGFLAPEGERGTFSYASDVFACGKVLERLLIKASPAAADFLGTLLQEDAERRPSAIEALQHPWLCQESEVSSQTQCMGDASRSPCGRDTSEDLVELSFHAIHHHPHEQRLKFPTGIRPPDAFFPDSRKEAASRSSTCGSLGELSTCCSVSTVLQSWASKIGAREASSPLLCEGIREGAPLQLGRHCEREALELTHEHSTTIQAGDVFP